MVFDRFVEPCKGAQDQYVRHCASELNPYYNTMMIVIASFLFIQLVILGCVLLFLKRARRRAMSDSPEMEEELLEGISARGGRDRVSQPGYALVLPAYYWFLRWECALCVLWAVFYGVCVWLEADPAERFALSSATADPSRINHSRYDFLVPKLFVFLCNTLGTTLDATLMLFLAHQNAGQKVWHRCLRWGFVLGLACGTLSILPAFMAGNAPSIMTTEVLRLSGYMNDSFWRLVLMIVVCLPIGARSWVDWLRAPAGEEVSLRRTSVSTLAFFKLVFAVVSITVAAYYFTDVRALELRNTGSWNDYKRVFKEKVFPARLACFSPWALFYILNGLVVYKVLWDDSNYWRQAGVRNSMFVGGAKNSLANPLLSGSRFSPEQRARSSMTPRFQQRDIIDFGAISLVRRIGGGASSNVWEAKLRVDSALADQYRRSTLIESKPKQNGLVRVAVKQLLFIEEITSDTIETACREAELLRALGRHPNVIGWFGICVSPPHLLLVTELCRPNLMCTHSPVGRRFIRGLSLRERLGVVSDVAAALIHLHTHGVVMRDLKCCNVLMDLETVSPKLCDFGIAQLITTVNSPASAFTLDGSGCCCGEGDSTAYELIFGCGMCCGDKAPRSNSVDMGGTVEFMAPEALEKVWAEERRAQRRYAHLERKVQRRQAGHRRGVHDRESGSSSDAGSPRDDEPADRGFSSADSGTPSAGGSYGGKGDSDRRLSDESHPTTIFQGDRKVYVSDEQEDGVVDIEADLKSSGGVPESIRREEMAALDMFSLGVFLWALMYVQDPWSGYRRQEVMRRVLSGLRLELRFPPAVAHGQTEIWEDLRNLMLQCWSGDPRSRPKASSVRILLTSLANQLAREEAYDDKSEDSEWDPADRKRRLTL